MGAFKNYEVKIVETKSRILFAEFQEPAKSIDYLKTKYKNKHEFDKTKKTIVVKRVIKKPGVQTNLLDLIAELTPSF